MTHLIIHDNAELLAAFVIASITMLAGALVFERLARGASAASRHTILVAAMLTPPLLIAATAFPSSAPPQAPAQIATASNEAAVPASPAFDFPCTLAALWLIGFAVAIVRNTSSALHWRGVARRAEKRNGFSVSDECQEPMVIGILRPAIVLPGGGYLESLSPAELEAVFAHERTHLARRDNLLAALVQLACAAFWFDPLHRFARRRLVDLRERACDEAVIAAGCDTLSYLTALARSCDASFRSSAVACMSRLHLRERMESIMTHGNQRSTPAWITRTATVAAIGIAVVAFGLVAPAPRIVASESDAPKKEKYSKLTDDMTPPKVVSRVNPIYPEVDKDAGIEGPVVLEAMISDRGIVEDVRVVQSLSSGLDQSAADAVRQWRFEPAKLDGKPVGVSLTITINFKLN
jgi:TonB family protein